MKIKLLTGIAGVNFAHDADEIVDLPERDALALVARGSAVRVDARIEDTTAVEAAVRVAPEMAAGRGRGRRLLAGAR